MRVTDSRIYRVGTLSEKTQERTFGLNGETYSLELIEDIWTAKVHFEGDSFC